MAAINGIRAKHLRQHSLNKIPLSEEQEYARELCGREQQRHQFYTVLGEHMLRNAGGYLANPSFFNQLDVERLHAHPGEVLQAARSSKYQPNEALLQRWCALHCPSWLNFLWSPEELHKPRQIDLHEMD